MCIYSNLKKKKKRLSTNAMIIMGSAKEEMVRVMIYVVKDILDLYVNYAEYLEKRITYFFGEK